MFSLAQPPLFARLHSARNVLIAGAGGGFDVFAGLPLGVALRGLGKRVHYLPALDGTRTAFDVALAIEDYRDNNDERRPKRALPH